MIGEQKTSARTVTGSEQFYRTAGKTPLVMKKEVPGFIATRLQEAIWREALHMVANGEATVEQEEMCKGADFSALSQKMNRGLVEIARIKLKSLTRREID